MWFNVALTLVSLALFPATTANSPAQVSCSEERAEVPTLRCKCSEFTTVFQPQTSDHPIFTRVQHFYLSGCDVAHLPAATFNSAQALTLIDIRHIRNLTFDPVLPKTLQTLRLHDIDTIDQIQNSIFSNSPTMREIEIENAMIVSVQPNTFDRLLVTRVSFVNVAFLDLPGDSLAFAFDPRHRPKLVFDACVFDRVETRPYAIAANITDIEFYGNVLNCEDMDDQVHWIAKLYENVKEDNVNASGASLCCETLSTNYCGEGKEFDDRMMTHLFRGSRLQLQAQRTCPERFEEYAKYVGRSFDTGNSGNDSYNVLNVYVLAVSLFVPFLF